MLLDVSEALSFEAVHTDAEVANLATEHREVGREYAYCEGGEAPLDVLEEDRELFDGVGHEVRGSSRRRGTGVRTWRKTRRQR